MEVQFGVQVWKFNVVVTSGPRSANACGEVTLRSNERDIQMSRKPKILANLLSSNKAPISLDPMFPTHA
jgi:hypothetical protein